MNLVTRGRQIDNIYFAGSVPPKDDAIWNAVKRLGTTPSLLPRSLTDGEADTTDHVLQLALLRLAIDSPKPNTIALLTGDGAGINSGEGFLADAIRLAARGWKFEVYDSNHKLVGSYTTASDGTVLTDYLLPGTYTVKEIIPEDSPYTCDAPNPKTVEISVGQTVEVTFTNRMKPGEIRIQKTDTHGEPLAGAEFLLEWSKDGRQWQTVIYTDSPDVTEGTCTTEGLTDGKLTSGADGVVRFTGLYSGSLYRVTETKAPKGYQLLTEPVYEGGIRKDDGNFIRLTVVNAPVFELPMTGSTGYTAMTAIQVGTGVALLFILIRLAKKRK